MENKESKEVEEVDLEDFAKRGQPVPDAKRYVIRIDKERKVVNTAKVTGREILALVGKTPEGYKLYQHKRGHQPVLVEPDRVVDLREPGVERFTTMPKDTPAWPFIANSECHKPTKNTWKVWVYRGKRLSTVNHNGCSFMTGPFQQVTTTAA
jgi:hypothetical protein